MSTFKNFGNLSPRFSARTLMLVSYRQIMVKGLVTEDEQGEITRQRESEKRRNKIAHS